MRAHTSDLYHGAPLASSGPTCNSASASETGHQPPFNRGIRQSAFSRATALRSSPLKNEATLCIVGRNTVRENGPVYDLRDRHELYHGRERDVVRNLVVVDRTTR